ncbi:MAG: Hsp20/alpha crystallin family protein [Saprospiraceae bacterium]
MRNKVFLPLVPIAQEIENMVDEFVNKGFHDVFGGTVWQNKTPSANISENENNFSIDIAAPGLEKKDFAINVENSQLHVSVSKENSEENKNENYFRKEFSFQSFKRAFKLPENADTTKITASYNNGVLNIVIEKKPIVKNEKTIEVQ